MTAPPGDPFCLQTPNLTLVVTKALADCLMDCSVSHSPIQMWMFGANHHTELRKPGRRAGRRTREEGNYNLIGRITTAAPRDYTANQECTGLITFRPLLFLGMILCPITHSPSF